MYARTPDYNYRYIRQWNVRYVKCFSFHIHQLYSTLIGVVTVIHLTDQATTRVTSQWLTPRRTPWAPPSSRAVWRRCSLVVCGGRLRSADQDRRRGRGIWVRPGSSRPHPRPCHDMTSRWRLTIAIDTAVLSIHVPRNRLVARPWDTPRYLYYLVTLVYLVVILTHWVPVIALAMCLSWTSNY